MKKLKKILVSFVFVWSLLFMLSLPVFAQEKVTILISGQAHASLYPCSCPSSPSGGVFRRATVINEIRQQEGNGNVVLIEAGGSFAGGNFDQNSQTNELDQKRTTFYMDALARMGCDAFVVSSEEFNFGDEFFNGVRSQKKFPFLSANLEGDFLPFVVKKAGSLDIAIIGITDSPVTKKTPRAYKDIVACLGETLQKVRENKEVDCTIVVGYLESKDAVQLIKETKGIDMFVSTANPFRPMQSEKVDNALLVVPAWETRSLTKITVISSGGKIDSVNTEPIVLDEKIKDDADMISVVPACFSDLSCHRTGYIGKCMDPASQQARCEFQKSKPATVTVIVPKACVTCDVNAALGKLKEMVPDVEVKILEENTKEGKKLIDDLGVTMLPAYLFDESVGQNPQLQAALPRIAKKVGAYYHVNMEFSGVSYFIQRKKIPNRLDVFFDVETKDIAGLLGVLQELKQRNKNIHIQLHFLAIEDQKQGLLAKKGKYEIEEYLRSACVGKYYPEKLWQYLSCRFKDIETAWWDDCALAAGIDPAKIKACAQSEEGKESLRGYIALTQELEVVFGPTFVIHNKEIFSSEGVPSVKELEELFKR